MKNIQYFTLQDFNHNYFQLDLLNYMYLVFSKLKNRKTTNMIKKNVTCAKC